jgi:hypothetical protein
MGKCQNQHKIIVDTEGGLIADRPCINEANGYIVDSFGILHLCNECYEDDFKRMIKSDKMEINTWQ